MQRTLNLAEKAVRTQQPLQRQSAAAADHGLFLVDTPNKAAHQTANWHVLREPNTP